MNRKPALLIIRDGWGENHNSAHDKFNAVKLANTPCADHIRKAFPRAEINACGIAVGLPERVMGNSEVGHQNIGAGRVVDQELVRISKAFASGELRNNATLIAAFDRVKRNASKLHLLGIVSDAGVHGLIEHLLSLLALVKEAGISEVYLHAFTDGRDTSPRSGLGYIRLIETKMKEMGVGRIATVCGRFWSMDRDTRWERVQQAYDCLTGRVAGNKVTSAEDAVQHYYDHPLDELRKGDEFVTPSWVVDESGVPIATIGNGDSVIFYNYRGDRPREITRAFIDDDFDGFERGEKLDLYYATMTEYQSGLCPNLVFERPPKMKAILGLYLSELGIPQFRCAETEKYPHVTFFFNDYREEPFPGEDRKIIPSTKEVTTYDQKPEMSARGICEATKEAIRSGKYGLIVVNFANPDMVGHTGSLEAVIRACEVVDQCVGELLVTLAEADGVALVTADHGNADQMWDTDVDGPHTSHTLNPVEVVIIREACKNI